MTSVNSFLWNFLILYCLHKSQRHLCVVFIIYSFLFSKNYISNDCFHTAHIFNFIQRHLCVVFIIYSFFSKKHISNYYFHTAHIFNFILYCLHKSQHHLCVVFIIYSFLFSKNHISNDCFHTTHIFNFISAIYYWIYLKLWWLAFSDLVNDTCSFIDLVDDTGSYRGAVNSYPLTYPGVKSILHTFSILSAPSINEFFKTLINCLNWLSIWYGLIQTGCKQLSPCLSGV